MDSDTPESIASVIRENTKPEAIGIGKRDEKDYHEHSVMALPDGMRLHSLKEFEDQYKSVPDFRKDAVTTTDLGSFIEHVKRFASPDTVAFATKPQVTGKSVRFDIKAVVDHHPAGSDLAKAGGQHHKINYNAQISDRASRWLSGERTYLNQAQFASFIEDELSNLSAIENFKPPFGSAVATPADMLTLSRGLEVRVKQTVRNATRLSSGETELVFSTENTKQDGSPLVVPEWFFVRLPIFAGGDEMILPLRLRYLVDEGVIKFSYLFHNFDQVLEHTVQQAVSKVRTALPELHLVEGVI